MNERIKEIAKQCYETGPIGKDGWPEYSRLNEQKFAELLVSECVQIAVEQKQWVQAQQPAFNYDDARWDRARIQQSERIIEKIQEHFGIEL